MKKTEFSGYLSGILFILLILLLIKALWMFIAGIILLLLIVYFSNRIYQAILDKKHESEINYTPDMGEVYKICPYCNTKVKVTASECPCCKRTLN